MHAMLRAWREVGYIAMNSMGFHGAGTQRKVNANRSVSLDLYDLVLETMEADENQISNSVSATCATVLS
jgi:integrase/recombinase XerC